MLTLDLIRLLSLLDEAAYHTAQALADQLGVSEKTVRKRLKELGEALAPHGAGVVSKQKYGYRLKVNDCGAYAALTQSFRQESQERLPSTPDERVSFLLSYLISRDGYVKLEGLSDFLYVSRNTITADLKKVDYILSLYHLELERRPNHGLRVLGSEFHKRICITNNLLKSNPLFRQNLKMQDDQHTVGSILLDVLGESGLRISETSFQSLVMHIYIAQKRIKQGFEIQLAPEQRADQGSEAALRTAQRIAKRVGETMCLPFSPQEVSYIAIHLAAKISSETTVASQSNLEITSRIDELTMRLIESIYHNYNVDFRDNLELRMSLNQHLVPLDVRLRYGIPLQNPVLGSIKQEYSQAYAMAAQAGLVLREHYGKPITEDEIGYLAILLEFALEKRGKAVKKKNIVVVCASGKGSSQLFIYKYKQAFHKYIDRMVECTIFELDGLDFTGIDYVFTTIPLPSPVPVPVFEVNLFPDAKDMAAVQTVLEKEDMDLLARFYRPALFVSGLHCGTKEEAIRTLCTLAGEHYTLPDEFYGHILKREALGQTDFGNLAAIPHPYTTVTKDSFAVVGILDKPIWWGHNDVQAIFLISISDSADRDVECFFKATTNLLFDTQKMQRLLRHPTYEMLMESLGG